MRVGIDLLADHPNSKCLDFSMKRQSCTTFAFVFLLLVSGCGGGDVGAPAAPQSARQSALDHGQGAKLERSAKLEPAAYANVVQDLYVGYFGRPADPAGLANFELALAAADAPLDIQSLALAYSTNPGVKSLVDSFGTSAESIALYGSGNTSQFVTAIFQNVLNRAPLQAGLSFWSNAIDSGSVSRGNAAVSIIAGALANQTAQGQLDAQLIGNKIAVAMQFTSDITTPPQIAGYAGPSAAATARSLLSTVSATTDVSALAQTIASTVVSIERFVIRGTAYNLNGPVSLTLVNNGVDPVVVNANGAFAFAKPMLSGANYSIAVAVQPVGQSCVVVNGAGQVGQSDVVGITVSCHQLYAYVIARGDNSIVTYRIGTDGGLVQVGNAALARGGHTVAFALDPQSHFLYAVDDSVHAIMQYAIGADGIPVTTPLSTVPSGDEPNSIVFDPSGSHVYVADVFDQAINQYSVQPDGSLAQLTPQQVSMNAHLAEFVAVDPSGKFVYAVGIDSLDAEAMAFGIGSDGTLQFLGQASTASSPYAVSRPIYVAVSPNSRFVYTANYGDSSVSQFAVAADGTLAPLNPLVVPVGFSPTSLALDPLGKYLYVVNQNSDSISQFDILADGSLKPMSAPTAVTAYFPQYIAVDPSGRFAYVTNRPGATVSQYAIGSDGSLTPLSPATVPTGTFSEQIVIGR